MAEESLFSGESKNIERKHNEENSMKINKSADMITQVDHISGFLSKSVDLYSIKNYINWFLLTRINIVIYFEYQNI